MRRFHPRFPSLFAAVAMFAGSLGLGAEQPPPAPVGETLTPAEAAHRWTDPDGKPLPFETEDQILEFLKTADVVSDKTITSGGITMPRKLVIEKDGVRADAIFRVVDEEKMQGSTGGGRNDLFFRDCYIFEPAAYELLPHARPRQRAPRGPAQGQEHEGQHPDLARACHDRREEDEGEHQAAGRSAVAEAGADHERVRRAHLQHGPQSGQHPDRPELEALDDRPHAHVPAHSRPAARGQPQAVRAQPVPQPPGARRSDGAAAPQGLPDQLRARRALQAPQDDPRPLREADRRQGRGARPLHVHGDSGAGRSAATASAATGN